MPSASAVAAVIRAAFRRSLRRLGAVFRSAATSGDTAAIALWVNSWILDI
jgi:hypothetical protein